MISSKALLNDKTLHSASKLIAAVHLSTNTNKPSYQSCGIAPKCDPRHERKGNRIHKKGIYAKRTAARAATPPKTKELPTVLAAPVKAGGEGVAEPELWIYIVS